MALELDAVVAARERLNAHLGRQSYQLLSAHDLRELLQQPASDEVRLDALTCLGRLREDLDDIERDLIEALRVEEEHEPASWTRIGSALGMTRQGAEGRYLRLTSTQGRVVARGRTARAAQAKDQEDLRRRSRARWGHYAVAERAWVVRLRVRTHAGEELELLAQGPPGQLPRLAQWRTERYRFVGDDEIAEVLEVVTEQTPWAGVEARSDFAGLPGHH